MKYLIIGNSLGIKGTVSFKKEAFFTLQPGQKVTRIGDGRETGSYRTDFFVQPFEYVGSFIGANDTLECKYFAFQVPPSMIPDEDEPHYLLYESTGLEPMRRTKSYDRFFAPEFLINNLL